MILNYILSFHCILILHSNQKRKITLKFFCVIYYFHENEFWGHRTHVTCGLKFGVKEKCLET